MVVKSSRRFVSSSIINPKSILCIIVEVIQKMRLAAPLTLDISYSENSLGSTTSAEAFTSNCYIYQLYVHHCPKHLLWPFRFNISRQTTANNFENGFPLPLCHDRVLWKLGVDISIHMNIFIMHNLKYPGLQCPRPAWPQPHSPASYLLELQTPAWNLLLSSNSFETKHNRLVTRIILYKNVLS